MDGPPPPPPPHGANPNTTEGTPKYRKSTDLPDGQYDIFVVPPHSAGSGFIYLPSLQCHRNSFIAGSLSTLLVVAIWAMIQPTVKMWMATTNATGGMGIILLVVGVGLCGWYFGTIQSDAGPNHTGNRPRPGGGFGSGYQYNNAHQGQNGAFPGGAAPPPGSQYSAHNTGGHFNAGGPHQNAHQNTHNADGSNTNSSPKEDPKEDPKKAQAEWERAREEAQRKETLRRKMEAIRKKREEEEAQKRRQQEREAMEKELKERKEQLEREAAAARAAAEKEVRERAEREAAEKEERAKKEAAEREERAKKEAAEREERAKREAAEKEAAAKEAAKKEAALRFAEAKQKAAKRFEKMKEEKAAKEKAASAAGSTFSAPNLNPAPASAPSAAPPRTPSPQKPPPRPTARTANEDDAYSFRPYDRPRRPYGGASAPSVYSESSSYAPSQSTARTTPPPSHHQGPYTTKDPKKVVIHGVYAFNNAFQKTPMAQLVSGQRPVTDGLVLRISTEGWFVDDDVRGVAQREWDAKAWTMKQIESVEIQDFHIVRASLRDQEGKKFVFVLDKSEAWKVTQGLQRLRGSSQVRALNVSKLPLPEGKTLLANLGYI